MEFQVPENLTVDGVDYPLNSFSEQVQQLVHLHTNWRNDLQKERIAVSKTESAIRLLESELAKIVSAELAKPTEDSQASVPTTGE